MIKVIHQSSRSDRLPFLLGLAAKLGDIGVVEAVTLNWDDPMSRAVRGCALSHLAIVDAASEDVLVLEDDAVFDAQGWQEWGVAKEQLPADCGAVILGGEVWKYGAGSSFYQINDEYEGTHAVWYPAQKLREHDFVKCALGVMASQPIGHPKGAVKGISYESVLLQALKKCGLNLYRPPRMAFSAAAGFSARELKPMAARNRAFDIRSKPEPEKS